MGNAEKQKDDHLFFWGGAAIGFLLRPPLPLLLVECRLFNREIAGFHPREQAASKAGSQNTSGMSTWELRRNSS